MLFCLIWALLLLHYQCFSSLSNLDLVTAIFMYIDGPQDWRVCLLVYLSPRNSATITSIVSDLLSSRHNTDPHKYCFVALAKIMCRMALMSNYSALNAQCFLESDEITSTCIMCLCSDRKISQQQDMQGYCYCHCLSPSWWAVFMGGFMVYKTPTTDICFYPTSLISDSVAFLQCYYWGEFAQSARLYEGKIFQHAPSGWSSHCCPIAVVNAVWQRDAGMFLYIVPAGSTACSSGKQPGWL